MKTSSSSLCCCVVCLCACETGTLLVVLPCSHCLHAECLMHWCAEQREHTKCPVCRAAFPMLINGMHEFEAAKWDALATTNRVYGFVLSETVTDVYISFIVA